MCAELFWGVKWPPMAFAGGHFTPPKAAPHTSRSHYNTKYQIDLTPADSRKLHWTRYHSMSMTLISVDDSDNRNSGSGI